MIKKKKIVVIRDGYKRRESVLLDFSENPQVSSPFKSALANVRLAGIMQTENGDVYFGNAYITDSIIEVHEVEVEAPAPVVAENSEVAAEQAN